MTKKDLKEKEHEECLKKIEELENQVKRTLADYQNLEKRSQNEKREWARISNKELLLRLLPVLDTLILASKHAKDQGLIVAIKQFEDVLKGEGVDKVQTVGREFNPETMECVETIEGEEGKVIEELSSGYLLNDKLLRPARVKVGKENNDDKDSNPIMNEPGTEKLWDEKDLEKGGDITKPDDSWKENHDFQG